MSKLLGAAVAGVGLLLLAAPAAAQNQDVLCVQEELAARGADPGPLDGAMGGRTRTASAAIAAQEGITLDALSAANAAEWCAALRPWHRLSAGTMAALEPYARTPLPAGTVGPAPFPQWAVGDNSAAQVTRGGVTTPSTLTILTVLGDNTYEARNGANGNLMIWRGDLPFYGTSFDAQGAPIQTVTWTGDLLDIFPLEVGRSSFATYVGDRVVGEDYSGGRYCEVLGEEEVTVPNATYATYHIACASDGEVTNGRPDHLAFAVHHFWYAPSVGDTVLNARDTNFGVADSATWREKPMGP